jgi:hypothetical protein
LSVAPIKNKWDYDVAARLGIAFDRALIYGKADGLGLGQEYAFTNNWTTKFEFPLLGVTRKTFAHTEFFSV